MRLKSLIIACFAIFGIALFIIFFGKTAATIVFTFILLACAIWLARYKPKRLKKGFDALNAMQTREIRYILLWMPFFLLALFMYQKFWQGNPMMIYILGGGSIVITLVAGKALFNKRK
jgi:hypothetical protein